MRLVTNLLTYFEHDTYVAAHTKTDQRRWRFTNLVELNVPFNSFSFQLMQDWVMFDKHDSFRAARQANRAVEAQRGISQPDQSEVLERAESYLWRRRVAGLGVL